MAFTFAMSVVHSILATVRSGFTGAILDLLAIGATA
jgi:hypothetical protein